MQNCGPLCILQYNNCTHTHTPNSPGGRGVSAEWRVHCSTTARQWKWDHLRGNEVHVSVQNYQWVRGLTHLQHLLVQLQALALDEISSSGGQLVRQVPQSTQGKLQSGVHRSQHGSLLHNSQQLLQNRMMERDELYKTAKPKKKENVNTFLDALQEIFLGCVEFNC